MIRRSHLSLILLLASAPMIPAQLPTAEIHTEEPKEATPYWQETVDEAIAHYRSENPAIRRSAVMLLGKYPVDPARKIVIDGLEDEASTVRQAALVSLLEEFGQITPEALFPMIRRLTDPEVSIRRIASNSITTIIQRYPYQLVVTPNGGQQFARQLPPETIEILQSAYRDPDRSVRKNMVKAYSTLSIPLPQETIAALVDDPETDVAIEALHWALPSLTPPNLNRAADRLSEREDLNFRLEWIRSLEAVDPRISVPIVQKLQNDPAPRVALEAKLRLLEEVPTAELFTETVTLWQKHNRSKENGIRLIYIAQLIGEPAIPFLLDHLQTDDPELRQYAVQAYFGLAREEVEFDLILKLLDDRVDAIRQQAIHAWMRLPAKRTLANIQKAAANRFSDVRRIAANMTTSLPPTEAEEILFKLLFDSDRSVQISAIRQIVSRRIDGWEEIASVTLEERDPNPVQAVTNALTTRPDRTSLDFLHSHLRENPDSVHRPQIETAIKRIESFISNR